MEEEETLTKKRECLVVILEQALPIAITTTLSIPTGIIGYSYFNECSIEKYIPIWLMIHACNLLIMSLIVIVIVTLGFIAVRQEKNSCTKCFCMTTTTIVIIVLSLVGFFTGGWFFVGSYWVFKTYPQVDFFNATSPYYCPESVYQAALWNQIAGYAGFGAYILIYIMAGIVYRCSSDV